ncbi:P-loop containing nucleoside triphosphate hydrolase protein [Pyronema omphalodes]|nr:P-loop containing nucleoside triphosphate hydrolase protein [Pyronema omphalodes]
MPPKKALTTAIATAARFGRVRNNLKMGVVGLPNVGKSSLFNLLTSQSAAAENYPFCTIEPNEARCPVPDDRFDYLVKLYQPKQQYPAFLSITDIAGLIAGASEGAGLGNAFLSHIQAVDGIYQVVRAFENSDVVHVENSIDPVRDLGTINQELCKKDLAIVNQGIEDEAKARKKVGAAKRDQLFDDVAGKIQGLLEKYTPVRDGKWEAKEVECINEKLRLITTKPMVYLVNMEMNDYAKKGVDNKWLPEIRDWIKGNGGGSVIPMSVDFEQALWDRKEDPKQVEEFLKKMDAKSTLPEIIREGFQQLGLIYYFTAGEKEVKAWTIREGTMAPQAAGVIHGDFEKGFIKAEVVGWEDFKRLGKAGSMADIKAAGKLRMEGKQYIVKDGDVVHFMVNAKKKK